MDNNEQPPRTISNAMTPCFACGGLFDHCDGPVHRYMTSSAGCWKAYGTVLAREYSDRKYWANHRLTVDAYAAQHPGGETVQAIQSVGLHLTSLYWVLEANVKQEVATRALKRMTEFSFHWLRPPAHMGLINVGDVVRAGDPHGHATDVKSWAESVWASWHEHHATVKRWADRSGF